MQMVMLGMKDPKMLVQEVLRLPIKRLFWKGIRYRKLRMALYIFGFLLAMQLKFSRRARTYAVRTSLLLMFGVTFFGLLGTLVVLIIKLRLHSAHADAKVKVLSKPPLSLTE